MIDTSQLRNQSHPYLGQPPEYPSALLHQAADEIDRLRSEIDRLRATLGCKNETIRLSTLAQAVLDANPPCPQCNGAKVVTAEIAKES
jgi:hypothetical protein